MIIVQFNCLVKYKHTKNEFSACDDFLNKYSTEIFYIKKKQQRNQKYWKGVSLPFSELDINVYLNQTINSG